jgi:hypothetical protein
MALGPLRIAFLSFPIVAWILPAAAAAADPDRSAAIAACRKHVESLLHESVETRYEGDLRVERLDERTLRIAGLVTSRSRSGTVTRADFRCQATRHGPSLWGTRTELAFP